MKLNLKTSSIFDKSRAGLLASNTSSILLFTPIVLILSKQGCERLLCKQSTFGFQLKFKSLTSCPAKLQCALSFLNTVFLSPRAAFAEAGLGVGEAGGVEIASISLFILIDSANFIFSSGQEIDRGFAPQCSTGCQTEEARGTHDNCLSELSLSGNDREEHNFLLAGGLGVQCMNDDESASEQFLQYVLFGR